MSDPQPSFEMVDDLPDIIHRIGHGGLVAVDDWITSNDGGFQFMRMHIGVALMRDTDPDPQWPNAPVIIRRNGMRILGDLELNHTGLSTIYRARDLDGVMEPAAFRVCPEHLGSLDDELRCTEGHTCKTWMVRVNRRIQFDAEFKAECPAGDGE